MVSDQTLITVSGILAIVIIEAMALYQGIDGIVLTATVSTLATILGYSYGINKQKS